MFQKSTNYIMPAEWAPHKAIWIAWPYDEITFPNRVSKVQTAVVQIISAIHQSEQVELLVLNKEMQQQAERELSAAKVDM